MRVISSIILIFICLISTRVESVAQKLKSEFNQSLSDAKEVFSSPAHYQTSQWIAVSSILASSVLILIYIDEPVRTFSQQHQSSSLNFPSQFGRYYGNGLVGFGVGGLIYLGGIGFNDVETRTTGRVVMESVLISGAITTVIKSLCGRARPFLNEGKSSFHGLQFSEPNLSFPSGHTTVAFAVSSALSSRIKKTWVSIILYGFASATIFNRVYDDRHWLSDCVIGAVIGTSVGITVSKLNDTTQKKSGLSLSTQSAFSQILSIEFKF